MVLRTSQVLCKHFLRDFWKSTVFLRSSLGSSFNVVKNYVFRVWSLWQEFLSWAYLLKHLLCLKTTWVQLNHSTATETCKMPQFKYKYIGLQQPKVRNMQAVTRHCQLILLIITALTLECKWDIQTHGRTSTRCFMLSTTDTGKTELWHWLGTNRECCYFLSIWHFSHVATGCI